MDVSVSEAKAILTDLVRKAEGGEDIVLTRHGAPVARITAMPKKLSPSEFDQLVQELQEIAARTALPSTDAAHSHDFLYDENGLPG